VLGILMNPVRTLRGRAGLWLAAVGVVGLLRSASPAGAQTPGAAGEGLGVGHFVLYPSLTIDYTQDDNVFYTSVDRPGGERIRSGVTVVRPRILAEFPLGANRIRAIYAPTFRTYSTSRFTSTDRVSHFFDLDGSFQVGPSLKIGIRDHLVRGTTELQEVDLGGEITFGLVPFVTHSPEMEINLRLGARGGLSLIPRYAKVSFDERGDEKFFSYTKREFETRLNYSLSSPTTVYLFYAVEDTDQNREQLLFGDVNQEAGTVGVGLRRMVNRDLTGQFSAGYRSVAFKGGAGRNFAGPVLDASGTWRLADGATFALSLRRQAYQSFFVNNNYYVNNEIRLRLTRQVGLNFYWDASAAYGRNLYADPLDIRVTPATPPEADCDTLDMGVCVGDGIIDAFASLAPSVGRRRRDQIARLEIGAGFLILRTLRVFLGYNLDRRGSNIEQLTSGGIIEPFDYRVNRIFVRVAAGWL
jgi:hypothetical protein